MFEFKSGNTSNLMTNKIFSGKEAAEKLHCCVCSNLSYLPQFLSCCKNLVCHECLQINLLLKNECPSCKIVIPVYVRPDEKILALFEEVVLNCKYTEKGCEEKMSYSKILAHEKRCQFNPNRQSIGSLGIDFSKLSFASHTDFSLK